MGRIELHKALRKLINQRKMAQKELAIQSGLSESYMSRIMSGERVPDLGSIDKIACVLEVSVASLILRSTSFDFDTSNNGRDLSDMMNKAEKILDEVDRKIYEFRNAKHKISI